MMPRIQILPSDLYSKHVMIVIYSFKGTLKLAVYVTTVPYTFSKGKGFLAIGVIHDTFTAQATVITSLNYNFNTFKVQLTGLSIASCDFADTSATILPLICRQCKCPLRVTLK
jgi:hypothetical protein